MPASLKRLLAQKYDEGYRIFRAGGAMGFDTAAALSVLELRQLHPDVKLELILPCKDQTAKWRERDVKIYESILARSDSVIYAEEYYVSGCMHKRNRMLVNGAACCIAYYNGGSGGTAYTYNYAKQMGIEVINIW